MSEFKLALQSFVTIRPTTFLIYGLIIKNSSKRIIMQVMRLLNATDSSLEEAGIFSYTEGEN